MDRFFLCIGQSTLLSFQNSKFEKMDPMKIAWYELFLHSLSIEYFDRRANQNCFLIIYYAAICIHKFCYF